MRTDVSGWNWKDLVEHLQQNYGIGMDDGTLPYYKWRAREAAKVRNLCKSRRVDVTTVVRCAEYCRATNQNVESVGGLLSRLHEAAIWDKARNSSLLEEDISAAVAREQSLGDEDSERWINQLLRARPSKQEEVLDAWRMQR